MKQTYCHSSRTALFGCVLTWASLIQPVAAEALLVAVPAAWPAMLNANAFRHYFDTFSERYQRGAGLRHVQAQLPVST